MVSIPRSLRTVAGLDKAETRALVFIVERWRQLEKLRLNSPALRSTLDSRDVTKYLKREHAEGMKVVNSLRQKSLVALTPRLSGGETGYGWGGSLFGALRPSQAAMLLVDEYLAAD